MELLFALQCLHCSAQFFSQASLRAHLRYGQPKCRQVCVKCGCCRDIFLEREKLAFHLNQPGINKRPAASSPSDFLVTTSTHHVATTATATVTQAAAPQTSGHIRRTVCDLGPPPPVRPSMPLVGGIGADPAALDWQGWTVEDWLQQDPSDMSQDRPSLGQYEVISPAVSAIPRCTLTTVTATSTLSCRGGWWHQGSHRRSSQGLLPRIPLLRNPPTVLDASRRRRWRRWRIHRQRKQQRLHATALGRRVLMPLSLSRVGDSGRTSQPIICIGWPSRHSWPVAWAASVPQQQQLKALDNSSRSELATDSAPRKQRQRSLSQSCCIHLAHSSPSGT